VDPKQHASIPTDSQELLKREADLLIVVHDQNDGRSELSAPILIERGTLKQMRRRV